MIKDFIEKLQNGDCSPTELKLTGACILFAGIVIGMFIAPKRIAVYGSFNGNQGGIGKPGKRKK